jgi:hypothetical protein
LKKCKRVFSTSGLSARRPTERVHCTFKFKHGKLLVRSAPLQSGGVLKRIRRILFSCAGYKTGAFFFPPAVVY